MSRSTPTHCRPIARRRNHYHTLEWPPPIQYPSPRSRKRLAVAPAHCFPKGTRVETFARTVGCSMKLRLGWQVLVFPDRVFARFIVGDVNGRVRLQRVYLEHAPTEPLSIAMCPEVRRLGTLFDKLHIVGVCYFIAIDTKRWYPGEMLPEFIIPTKSIFAIPTESCQPSRDLHRSIDRFHRIDTGGGIPDP